MNKVNSIIFSLEDFISLDNMRQKVAETVLTLIEGKNIVQVFNLNQNNSVVRIEYMHNDPDNPKPFWLSTEEAIIAQKYHNRKELQEMDIKLKELSRMQSLFPDEDDIDDDDDGNDGPDFSA